MDYSVDNIEINLGDHAGDLVHLLEQANHNNIVSRIWSGDYTVWRENPNEISNRLGWLTIAERMEPNLVEILKLKVELMDSGFTEVLLLGMGGSSLAPELFAKTFATKSDSPALRVNILDSTDADVIQFWRDNLNLKKTAFIVATKSGGTVETLSLFKYFYNELLDVVGEKQVGDHFIGITDPGSRLVEMGESFKFRKIFENDPNIGGRYSALSYFGLVPAGFTGVDLESLLESSMDAVTHCQNERVEDNPGALLGMVLGALANRGIDKATFFLSPEITRFGDWLEQLIAESTGKDGTGILPVVHESIGDSAVYGEDRVFILIQTQTQPLDKNIIKTAEKTGQPVISIEIDDLYSLGGQFFTWEYAIAVAGYALDINPFNQPNVESAKIRARKMIDEYQESGSLPEAPQASFKNQEFDKFLAPAMSEDYIAIHAYLPYDDKGYHLLQNILIQLRDKYKLATTLGYGPRFLHSTGQLHKGDRGNGKFIQFISTSDLEIPIPVEPGTTESVIDFDTLKHAQALGDASALQDAGRPVIHFELGSNWKYDLERFLLEENHNET